MAKTTKAPAKPAAKTTNLRASYSADADALQKIVDTARKGMPGLKDLTAPRKGKGNAAGGVVSDKFIEGIAAQAEKDPLFQAATQVDATRLRNGNRFVVAYAPVADSLMTLGQETQALVLQTRVQNSEEARTAYAWMQWKAEHHKDASYARVVKNLQKIMKAKTKTTAASKAAAKDARAAARALEIAAKAKAKLASKTTVTETVTEKTGSGS